MSGNSVGPVRFDSATFTTASLGDNDPQVGERAFIAGTDYVFCYNEGGSVIAAGFGAVPNGGMSVMSVTVSAATSDDAVCGVAVVSIAASSYGWLATRGVVNVEAGETMVTGELIEVAANGDFAPVSNTTGNAAPAVGKALDTIATDASGSAYINCF